jgi:dTDP-4-amino-4,6-dideoxygalactose transaminase
MKVPFSRPLIIGTEQDRIADAISSGNLSANGTYTRKCNSALEQLGYRKALLTTSCTAALEMSALLLGLGPGDEVIVPSYAFITTANAFALRGVTIRFADSFDEHPNIAPSEIERLVNPKTKAIIALHYGGVSCDMDTIIGIANKHNIAVIEDNAQGISASYRNKPLGSIGDFGAISFHDSKNVHCAEGGALLVNREDSFSRSEVVWDMGTNRKDFRDGKVEQYGWVDLGSSYYPSELNAAFLYAQLKELDRVNSERINYWKNYHSAFEHLEKEDKLRRPNVPDYAKHNAHVYYIVSESKEQRDQLIEWLKENEIGSAFHFQSLHQSPFFKEQYAGPDLRNADMFSQRLVRLPLYCGLEKHQDEVIGRVLEFYHK